MALETRIAMIGVVGALTGTLVGGLVTYAVTQDQISSQRAESRRADRLNAYSTYFGDASRLWTQVYGAVEVTPRPKQLSPAAVSDLQSLESLLAREYALVALVAPTRVRDIAHELQGANTTVWNALNSVPIDYTTYADAKSLIQQRNSLLLQFLTAARQDLGTAN